MNRLKKIYSDCKVLGLSQMIVDGSKWYDTQVTDFNDIMIIAERGCDGLGRKIRKMALSLQDIDGCQKLVDFDPEEILLIYGDQIKKRENSDTDVWREI